GSAYLIMRTEGEVQRHFFGLGLVVTVCTFGAAIATMILMPSLHAPLAKRWTSEPFAGYLLTVFSGSAAAFLLLIRSLAKRQKHAPFLWSLAIFLLTFCGVWAGIYPYIVPATVTAQAAASSSETLVIMLASIGMLIPVIIFYNGYVYLVFRGDITEESGYGEP
nr:cytochrome d ubiquinol oxidase subunit II [Desulfobacteraceae bacterium]